MTQEQEQFPIDINAVSGGYTITQAIRQTVQELVWQRWARQPQAHPKMIAACLLQLQIAMGHGYPFGLLNELKHKESFKDLPWQAISDEYAEMCGKS